MVCFKPLPLFLSLSEDCVIIVLGVFVAMFTTFLQQHFLIHRYTKASQSSFVMLK